MRIINKYGIFHTMPDGSDLPAGARLATAKEVADWQSADALNKAAVLAHKRTAAATRAQFVVVSGEVEAPASPLYAGGLLGAATVETVPTTTGPAAKPESTSVEDDYDPATGAPKAKK